jgi:hypothetical protein
MCQTTRNEIFNLNKNTLTRMPQDRRSITKVALSLTGEIICISQAKTGLVLLHTKRKKTVSHSANYLDIIPFFSLSLP